MNHAKSKWKILRLVFIAVMTITWGLWFICILGQLGVLHLPVSPARATFSLLLAFMGLLLVWSFVIYWREPRLARIGWLSLLAIILSWIFLPVVSGL